MKPYKNRNRSVPSFANINLQGPCNYQCYFCLGRDIEHGYCHNYLSKYFKDWDNLDQYLKLCKDSKIRKIYLTGQNTDPLLYPYLQEFIDYLKEQGFLVGIRTNGVLALEKIKEINSLNEEVGISIHSLVPETNQKITGVKIIPDWDTIFRSIQVPLRVAIVVTRYNQREILSLLSFLSHYENIRYIQLRCIATDERYLELKEDIDCYDELVKEIEKKFPYIRDFYTASIYRIYGKEVSLWKTVQTTINSYNYFTDGVISKDYFIVEGYKNAKEQDQK